jgi:Tfp pilus assembly protein PilN
MSLINLLPQDYYQRRQGRRTNVMCVILFAVVMTGIVSASMVSRHNAGQTQAVLDNLNRSYSQAAQTISQMQTLKNQKQTILDKRHQIEVLQDPVPKSIILAILTNARPDGITLLHVKLDSRFPAPKKHSQNPAVKASSKDKEAVQKPAPRIEPNVTVEIIGLAHTDIQVAHYLANLADSELTESVGLSYTQDYKPSTTRDNAEVAKQFVGLREFRLNCRLKKKIDAKSMADRWRLTERDALSLDVEPSGDQDRSRKLIQNVSGTQK